MPQSSRLPVTRACGGVVGSTPHGPAIGAECPNRCLSSRVLAQKCPKIKLSYTLFAQKIIFFHKKTQFSSSCPSHLVLGAGAKFVFLQRDLRSGQCWTHFFHKKTQGATSEPQKSQKVTFFYTCFRPVIHRIFFLGPPGKACTARYPSGKRKVCSLIDLYFHCFFRGSIWVPR